MNFLCRNPKFDSTPGDQISWVRNLVLFLLTIHKFWNNTPYYLLCFLSATFPSGKITPQYVIFEILLLALGGKTLCWNRPRRYKCKYWSLLDTKNTSFQFCFYFPIFFTVFWAFLIVSIVKPTRCITVSNLFYWSNTLHVSDGLPVHHHEFKTVHTATGICQTDTAVCLLAPASKQTAVSVWHMPVAVCTVLN